MVCAPFECLCSNFILPEPANHVYLFAFFEFAQFIVPYQKVEYLGSKEDANQQKDKNGKVYIWYNINTLSGSKLGVVTGYVRSDFTQDNECEQTSNDEASIKKRKDYIWNYLKCNLSGVEDYHIAAIMGNMFVETYGTFSPTKLQGGTKSTDESWYIDEYDYNDGIGWGLLQWTYKTRKRELYEYAQKTQRNVGNIDVQLEFLVYELNGTYNAAYSNFVEKKDLHSATEYFCSNIEQAGVPHLAEREAAANEILAEYGNE